MRSPIDDAISIHRCALVAARAELGDAPLVDAAATFATFEMMNRIADATGIRIGRGRLASIGATLAETGVTPPQSH